MQKILFLDIDGVLNNTKSVQNNPHCEFHSRIYKCQPLTIDGLDFDSSCVNALKHIIECIPELTIVISSTWRYNASVDNFKELFSLFDIFPHHVDMLPIPVSNAETGIVLGKDRGTLITDYVDNFTDVVYAALDDTAELYNLPFNNLWVTDRNIGLTMDAADAIIRHLNQ